jgi:chromosome segregation ATPase
MTRVHTEADIRAVCQHLIDTQGESALTRAAVQAGLKARAVERGLDPTAADHRAVSDVIAAVRAELRAARESAQGQAAAGAEDGPLPVGLESALARHAQEVERICRQSLIEAARQSEIGAQARIRQVETENAERLAALRGDLELVQHDAAIQAGQLDEAETALAAARAAQASTNAALEERIQAHNSQERETQLQLSAARDALFQAMADRAASDERAHVSELAHAKTTSELAAAREHIERLEKELAGAREAAKLDAAKVREAERSRDIAQGRLTALEEECAWLRPRLESMPKDRKDNEKPSRSTGSAREKAKSAGGR